MPLRVNKGIPIWSPPANIRQAPPPTSFSLPTRAATSHILEVPMIEQGENNWCWAACIQMIMAFFKHNVGQCNVARLLFQNRNCCANGKSCDEGCAPEDVARVLLKPPLGVSCRLVDGVISFNNIMDEINEGRPVAVGIMWITSDGRQDGGHLIIVRGWRIHNNGHYVKINDPFYGPGDISFSKLQTYYGPPDDEVEGIWKHTWTDIKRG